MPLNSQNYSCASYQPRRRSCNVIACWYRAATVPRATSLYRAIVFISGARGLQQHCGLFSINGIRHTLSPRRTLFILPYSLMLYFTDHRFFTFPCWRLANLDCTASRPAYPVGPLPSQRPRCLPMRHRRCHGGARCWRPSHMDGGNQGHLGCAGR